MDERLKQRLVGAVVLVVAAVVFVPMLLDSRDAPSPPRGQGMASAPAPAAEPQDATAAVIPLGGAAPAADGAREASAEPPGGAPPARASAAQVSPQASPQASSQASSHESPSSEGVSRAPAHKPAFAVQLASFSKSGNAQGLRDRLVAKGYSAYVVTTDSISRVYVGPQSSRAEAERVREKLLAETKLKGIVVEHAG